MRMTPLFRGWIPGQVPGGKNQTVLKDDGSGKLRTMPRRRGRKPSGDPVADFLAGKDEEPFERWRAAPVQLFEIQSKMRPRTCGAVEHEGPIRLIVDYWWADWHGRDEDGRMGAVGHVLQNGKVIHNDGQLRQFWRYHHQDTDRPGIAFYGWTEPTEAAEPWIPPEPIAADHLMRAGVPHRDQKRPSVEFL